jgi:hypothetical protein
MKVGQSDTGLNLSASPCHREPDRDGQATCHSYDPSASAAHPEYRVGGTSYPPAQNHQTVNSYCANHD